MNVLSPLVELGFGSTWLTEPGDITWTDVTAHVLKVPHITTERGASAARGRVDAGSCALSLKNDDRRFDPTYEDGDYFGQLLPGVPIRIRGAQVAPLVWDGEPLMWDGDLLMWISGEVPIWRGTVATWPQRYVRGNTVARVPIEAWDGFDKLSRAKIPRSALEKEILADSPLGYWKLSEQSGSVMSDVLGSADGEYNHGTTRLSTEAESDAGAVVRGIEFDGEHYGQSTEATVGIGDRPAVIEALFVPDPGNSTGGRTLALAGTGASGVGLLLNTSAPTDTTWTIYGACFDGDANNVAIGSAFEMTDAFRHIALRRPAASAAKVYVDGADATTSNGTSATTIAFAPGIVIGHSKLAGAISGAHGLLAHVAVYDSDIGAARIAVHSAAALTPLDGHTTDERIGWILDELGWPANLRDLEAGYTTLGPATFNPGDGALEYLRLVTASEDGALFIGPDGTLRFLDRFWRYLDPLATASQFTFTDTDGDRGYAEFDLDLDDELLVNVARFTRRGGTEQVAVNQASADQHGEAEARQSDLLQRTDAEVRALAEWTVVTRSTPLPRVPKIRVPLHRYSEADQATILGLDLGHRVTVERTPQGVGDPISLAFQIDGIRNDIGSGEWWWEAFVSPVPEDTASLFVLDESELDGVDVLAY